MKTFYTQPLFWAGLILRILCIFIVLPTATVTWYAPFLTFSVQNVTLDPWSAWIDGGGMPSAFPYGYAMWAIFLPVTLLFKLLSVPIAFAYAGTLLVVDIAILAQLKKMLNANDEFLLITYWLSPIVLVASYFFGYNDLVPVLFILSAILFVKRLRFFWAGVLCAAALSAKLSMIIAVPFFLIYFLHNRKINRFFHIFLTGLFVGVAVLLVPFGFSAGGVDMLINNIEIRKIYDLRVEFGYGFQLYLVPLIYCFMIYAAWRVKRLNFELFNATLGMAFLLVVILTPITPGWYVWIMPLLVSYQLQSDRFAAVLVGLLTAAYLLCSMSLGSWGFVTVSGLFNWLPNMPKSFEQTTLSILQTMLVALGMILVFRIWRETVSRNDFFRLSRKPFLLGIAGDSGAGKDTFSEAIRDLFGHHSVATISGDDYHLWDRQKPIWQVMTHLNPMANDLERFGQDVFSLTDGKSILSRHYDHATGKMSRPIKIKSNDFIIVSGLHALYSPIVRQCYSLKVFLDIDEDLRRFFKLRRDVFQRGHSVERVLASFARREPDSIRFIRPQAMHADLIFCIQPIHPRILEDSENHPLRFKLCARSRHGYDAVLLTRVLIGVCGLHVDMSEGHDGLDVTLIIEGEPTADDIEQAAEMICPNVFEFLDISPRWEDGVLGLMQLITLSHVNQALRKRFI
ncbi:uridine kinase [Pseudomonas typographi]|uniref:uridine kinase n=1 Tax=Pseudomonas typographi TaxID=2715964 RepID=UPI0016826C93|nr:uridine kinase [Pseudomonas typographi]MBD1553267.1 uridine kinase [Pseudomonas typographi]